MKMRREFETADHKYIRKEKLGEGGPAWVFKVENEAKEARALKVPKPNIMTSDQTRRFRNEIHFCGRFDHINVMKVLDSGFYYNEENRKVHFYVMPYYPTTLRKLIEENKLDADTVLPLFSGILAGVNAAHLEGHVHRDLKPENILADEQQQPVIADFGAAHFHQDAILTAVETRDTSRLANFKYAAPEQKEKGEHVDHRADIFALGLILNEMFTSKVPLGEGWIKIGDVAPRYAYLDAVVTEMIQQNQDKRPDSINIINAQLKAREREYFSQQRVDTLKKKVVPLAELSDEITFGPVEVVGVDLTEDSWVFRLNKSVNDKWIDQFHKIDDRGNGLFHAWPEQMPISKDQINVNCSGEAKSLKQSGQMIADLVKKYVLMTNNRYATVLKREREAEEQTLIRKQNAEKLRIEQAIRDEEERQRILKDITL